jgi:tetratricopeptide (TPR) repeat protein
LILLLALLCAAPERVVVVAKPGEKPGFFQKLGSALGKAAHRLYEKEDADVADGNALAAQNDPEGALKSYDRAQERLSQSPELHYDRAGQMLKLGSDYATRAHDEALQALQTSDKSLKASAAFELGLSEEQLGKPDEAMKAYEQALALDPDDADSKVNLELLLKTQEERKQSQPQQQQQSQDKNQQPQQQPDKSKGEEQQKNQQQQAGQKEQQKEEKKKEQAGQQQQQQPTEEKKEQQAQEQKPVDRSEAERLLDALRAGEKNLQVWRFAKDKHKEARRGDVEKDW